MHLHRVISIHTIIDYDKGVFSDAIDVVLKENCAPDLNLKFKDNYNPNPNYGKIKTEYINFVIPIYEKNLNIGVYNQEPFIAAPPISGTPDPILRLSGLPLEEYLTNDYYFLSGQTNSRLDEIDYYGAPIVNFNYSSDINTFTGILQKNNNTIVYVIDADNNNGYVQNTGIKYIENLIEKRIVFDKKTKTYKLINIVDFKTKGEGWTAENIVLEELVKNDYLIGVTSVTEVENEININRSKYNVFENHYILGEVNSMTDLITYRNNFFKLK